MGFYVESVDRPYQSGLVQEDIHVGLIVARTGAGQITKTDDTDTAADGLVTAPRRGDYIAEEDDETTDFQYKTAEDHRASYVDLDEAGAVVKSRTVLDNETDPAPDISDGTVVGVAHKDDDAFRGRLVEEGYTDDAATTFDEDTGNFTPVGTVYRDESTNYDEAVRFVVDN